MRDYEQKELLKRTDVGGTNTLYLFQVDDLDLLTICEGRGIVEFHQRFKLIIEVPFRPLDTFISYFRRHITVL